MSPYAIDLRSGGSCVFVSTGGNEDVFDADNHSISFWTKGEPNGDWGNWMTKTSETDGFMIRQHASGKTTMFYDIRGGGGDLSFAIDHSDNVWRHYVMIYDEGSNTKTMYEDGIEVASASGGVVPDSLNILPCISRQADGAG